MYKLNFMFIKCLEYLDKTGITLKSTQFDTLL